MGTDPVISGVEYSLAARATGFVSAVVKKTVPNAYPTDLTASYTLVMRPVTTATLQVTVRDTPRPPGSAGYGCRPRPARRTR